MKSSSFLIFLLTLAAAKTTLAQATRPDDTPKVNLGATLFADFTYQDSPTVKDADGNTIHLSSFNVTRAYINLTGTLNHWISFRITPDIARESGSGSSLSGSQTFRLKFAYGQFNLDDWTTKGSWLRLGVQETPYIPYTEGVYRYRFQGPIFVDREGFLSASDGGFSGHYTLSGDHGDLHAGFYNGETFAKTETNNEKAFQLRASLRPLPKGGMWRGLRVTGFYDDDHYVASAKRTRALGQVSFEHSRGTFAAEFLSARDRTSAGTPEVHATGYSLWATPKIGTRGWELLLRRDELKPNRRLERKRRHDIVGIAYWFQGLQKVTSALLLDYDSLRQSGFTPVRPNDTRYGVNMLINF